MGTHTDSNGTTQGALVVVFGMILGALVLVVVQRYTTTEKQRVLKEAYSFHENKQ